MKNLEGLLTSYLKHYNNSEEISISSYNIEGSICFVKFYTDNAQYYKETMLINIWEILSFLYSNNEKQCMK